MVQKPNSLTTGTTKKLTALKIIYDAAAAGAALTLAFVTRFALLYFERPSQEIRPDLRDIYLSLFAQHLGLFIVVSIMISMLFKKKFPKTGNHFIKVQRAIMLVTNFFTSVPASRNNLL